MCKYNGDSDTLPSIMATVLSQEQEQATLPLCHFLLGFFRGGGGGRLMFNHVTSLNRNTLFLTITVLVTAYQEMNQVHVMATVYIYSLI